MSSRANLSRTDLSKQVSRYLPDWIFTIKYRLTDIPKYLEVDYFSLSIFILYEPSKISDLNTFSYLYTRPSIYALYN